jgi:hypothetical protein
MRGGCSFSSRFFDMIGLVPDAKRTVHAGLARLGQQVLPSHYGLVSSSRVADIIMLSQMARRSDKCSE